jgi:short subunit dehydrogenase-like uncharacterized protein
VQDARPLAVLGATGYTGGLVVEHARELGLPLRLVGRNRAALDTLARPGEEVRVADATREQELIDAFDGACAVVSTAGPFLALGTKPVGAAIAVGSHYLDSSGEQEFARVVYDGFGDSAEERGVVLLTSFGIDYVPGDFASRLAAERFDDEVDEIVVAYSVTSMRTSSGTRRTVGHVMAQSLVAYEGGLVPSRFGKTTRRVRFPFGERTVVEWSGTEPLTVPRHTRVRSVRSYVRFPRLAAYGGLVGPLVAPLIRASGRFGGNPSPEQRARNRWTVVAEARAGPRLVRATLQGIDGYGLTAALLVRGAEALRNGEARAVGACAPAEAFDVHAFAPRLAPLLEVAGVDDA